MIFPYFLCAMATLALLGSGGHAFVLRSHFRSSGTSMKLAGNNDKYNDFDDLSSWESPSSAPSPPSSSSSSSSNFLRDLSKLLASVAISTSIGTVLAPQSTLAVGGGSSPVLEEKIKQLETSKTRGEVVQSLADLFEVSGEKNTLKARTKYKYRIIRAINDQRTKLTNDKIEWDSTLRYESGELKRRVDPFRTVDLKGYLQIAPVVGGAVYLVALFVQQALPELFVFAYPLAVVAFTAPIAFIVVFG